MVKIIGSWTNLQGYTMLRLSTNKVISLHKLIYQNLHGKVPKGYQVHHRDYNITHNCRSNLTLILETKHRKRHKC